MAPIEADPDLARAPVPPSAEDCEEIARRMAAALQDIYRLLAATQSVHWSVSGSSMALHRLTERQYTELRGEIAALRERIHALGPEERVDPPIAAEDDEEARAAPTVEEMIDQLATGHEKIVRGLRHALALGQDVGEEESALLISDRAAWHERAIWRLRSLIL